MHPVLVGRALGLREHLESPSARGASGDARVAPVVQAQEAEHDPVRRPGGEDRRGWSSRG